MEEIQLRPYQIKAISAIQEALIRAQKRIVVEMPSGSGKGIILIKTIEYLQKSNCGNILIVTNAVNIKEHLKHRLYTSYSDLIDINSISIETEYKLVNDANKQITEYGIIIFYDAIPSVKIYNALLCDEKTVIVFTSVSNEVLFGKKIQNIHFESSEIVFSYTFQDAINDGYITPAMDSRARGPALEVFSKQLLESFEYTQIDYLNRGHDNWDLVLQNNNQKLWVECKAYKSQDVSPYVANELLKTLVMRILKQKLSPEDVILLIVSSYIPSFQKR